MQRAEQGRWRLARRGVSMVNAPNQDETLDGLSQLWANLRNPNQPAQPPSPTMQPGYPGGPPNPTDLPVGGVRAPRVPFAAAPSSMASLTPGTPAPVAPPQPAAQPSAVPSPSDDPALTGARQRFTDTSKAFSDLLGQERDIGGKIAAVPQVNRADYKPSIGRKILGMVLGGIAGTDDPKFGAQTGQNYINKPYNRAVEAREKTLAPFLAQQNAVERQVPLLNASNQSAWREYQSGLEGKKLDISSKREQDTAEWHNTANDIRQEIADSQKEGREARVSQQHQNEIDKMASQSDNLDLKRDALKLQQQLGDMNASIRDRNATTGENAENDKAAQAEINQKQRPIMGRVAAMEHARALLLAEGGQEDQIKRLDGEIKTGHDQMDQIENDVRTRRAPAAPAGKSGDGKTNVDPSKRSFWNGREGKIVTLKDPKGNIAYWHLDKGTPKELTKAEVDAMKKGGK